VTVADRAPSGVWWSAPLSIEGLFNPTGQQRGGLLHGLLRAVPGQPTGDPLLRALAAHPFNTNPVLSGYLLAALAGHLRGGAAGRDETPEAGADAAEAASIAEQVAERVRTTLAPLLAGLGDRLFWAGVRPFVNLLGILSAILLWGEPALWMVLGYNAVTWYWRRRAWRVGSAGEAAVRAEIRSRALETAALRWAKAARFLLGAILGVALVGAGTTRGVTGVASLVLICGAGYGIARAARVAPLAVAWVGVGLAGLFVLLHLGLEGIAF